MSWDSAPHHFSTARNLESLFNLYGRGADRLLKATELDRGRKGVVRRLMKAPADVLLAWFATIAGHEFGHCQQAWLAGSRECHWIPAPGPYAFGRIITIDDFGALSPAGRQATIAGGVQASIAGADQLKRDMFATGTPHWSTAPLLMVRQLDLTQYGLLSPSPAEAGPFDYANDMTNYALRYGARSGQNPEAVHDQIVRGAIWNTIDPVSWFAAYSYIVDHVVAGKPALRPQGFRIGRSLWMLATHAWLSEVGVRYSLGVFVRNDIQADRGEILEVTSSWGEGQPAIGARWTWVVPSQLQIRMSADFWRQRASATPGTLESGGSFGGGLSRRIGRVIVSGDAGYKSAGAMLGRPQASGWWWSVGISLGTR